MNTFNELEFFIPLKREQVFTKPTDKRIYCTYQFYAEEREKMEEGIHDIEYAFEEEVFCILNQNIFNSLCSVVSEFKKLKTEHQQRLMDCFVVNFAYFSNVIKDEMKNKSSFKKCRNSIKIYFFLLEWMIDQYIDFCKETSKIVLNKKKNYNKKKKNDNDSDDGHNDDRKKNKSKNKEKEKEVKELKVEKNIETLVSALLKFVKSDFGVIFQSQLVEEELINSMIKLGFDLLEIQSKNKTLKNNSALKEKNFEYLQYIITKHSSGHSNNSIESNSLILKLTSKIVNLIFTDEQSTDNLVGFVVSSLTMSNASLTSLGHKIIHEVVDRINKEGNVESQGNGLKSVTLFLIKLSEKNAKIIYSNLSSLISFYEVDSYMVRNTLTELITNMILFIISLTAENEDTMEHHKKTKQNFIVMLFERIYDKSSHCRKTVLQCFAKLVENNCLEYPDYLKLIKEAYLRLQDEKSSVRKIALSLCNSLIGIYPSLFKQPCYLSYSEIDKVLSETTNAKLMIEKEINKLKNSKPQKSANKSKNTMDVEEVNENNNDENMDIDIKTKIEELEPKKDNLNNIIDLFSEYKEMVNLIDKIVEIAILLLGSKNLSDIIEAINLFVSLKKLNIQSANLGIKKMLLLIVKQDEKIVEVIVESYANIYFCDKDVKLQALLLVELTSGLSRSELICLKTLLKNLHKNKKISNALFKEIWMLFLRNPDVEVKKLNLTSDDLINKKKMIFYKENRLALILLNIFAEIDISILSNNSELLLKQLMTILKFDPIDWLLVNESLKATKKIYLSQKETSENCLLMITKILINHYGTSDNYWYQAMQELINTIFNIMDTPDDFCKYILIKFSKPIFDNNQVNLKLGEEGEDYDNTFTYERLAQFLFLIGHIALNLFIYCEKLELNLKKKNENQNTTDGDKKDNNAENIENEIDKIGGGKEAEIEYDIFLLQKLIEDDLLYNSVIAKFTPLVTNIAESIFTFDFEENKNNVIKSVYKTALLSLTKMMCISKRFCEKNLSLLFSIVSNDSIPSDIKCNIITSFGDLINRFPNLLNTEMDKIFKK